MIPSVSSRLLLQCTIELLRFLDIGAVDSNMMLKQKQPISNLGSMYIIACTSIKSI